MVSLDMRTVVFSFVLTCMLSTVIIIFLWKQYRNRYNGMGHLVYAFIFQMVAYILIILRGTIPEWISIEVGNMISVAGIFVGFIGLEKYTGISVRKIPDYILFAGIGFFSLWFTFIKPVPTARYVIITASYSILFSQCAWLMIFGVPRKMVSLTRFTGLVFTGLALLSAIKTAEFFITGEKPADYFQSATFEAVTMIAFAMLIVLLTISIAIMLSDNLLRDIMAEEDKFSTVFLTTPDAIILSSYPDGRMLEVNDKFVELSGFSSAEVIGKLPAELNLWANETERQDVIRELQETGIISRKDCTFRRKSNDLITVLVSTKVIRVKSKMMYVTSINDITERKKLQDQVRHERNLLRTLVDNLPDPVSIKDSEGRYLLNNKAHLQVLGADSQEEVFGKTSFDYFPEDDAETYVADDSLVLKTGKMILDKVEFARHLDTGFPYWHMTSKIPIKDDSGKPFQVLTISHDITERKRAEDILKETDEFNRSLLSTIPFGMDVVDETGTILFIGGKFRRLFGNDAIGRKCWELYCDNSTQCADCPLKSGIKTGTTSSYEAHGILGGKIFDINHTGMVYHGKNAMLEIFHDITGRKKSENELIRSKEKAEESDRLKTAFLHNISHEIRTPMNAIVGFSNLLHEPGLSQQDRDSYTEIISRSSHHLLSIVNDVIEISNVEAGRLKVTLTEGNLEKILEDLHAQFRTLAFEYEIEFCLEAPASKVPVIKTDCTKFIQVLTNLLNNAFKFTRSGKIRFGYRKIDSFLEFFVSDTGIGIDEEHQLRIFERFYQVDNTATRAHEGTGIGLSISKAFVETLGGRIWLQSVPGKGSTFYFTIPYINDNPNDERQVQV